MKTKELNSVLALFVSLCKGTRANDTLVALLVALLVFPNNRDLRWPVWPALAPQSP